MTPNLLVLNGNPKPDSLCHALAREYARSAEQRGARVTMHHVGELAFAPDLHHGYDEAQPLEPDLQAVQQLRDPLIFRDSNNSKCAGI